MSSRPSRRRSDAAGVKVVDGVASLTANQCKNLVAAVAAVLVIGISTWTSLDPDNYFFYNQEHKQYWRHPTVHFLVVCGLYVVEATFIAGSIKLGARLWPRTLVAVVLFLPR